MPSQFVSFFYLLSSKDLNIKSHTNHSHTFLPDRNSTFPSSSLLTPLPAVEFSTFINVDLGFRFDVVWKRSPREKCLGKRHAVNNDSWKNNVREKKFEKKA